MFAPCGCHVVTLFENDILGTRLLKEGTYRKSTRTRADDDGIDICHAMNSC